MGKNRRIWAVLAGLAGGTCLIICVACSAVSGLGVVAFDYLFSGATVGVGREAPEFELISLSGEQIRLSQFRGRPTVISFGTTW